MNNNNNTVTIGVTRRSLALVDAWSGLPAETIAYVLPQLSTEPSAVRRAVLAALLADPRRDVQRAVKRIWPSFYGEVKPENVRLVWARGAIGGFPLPFASCDIDAHGHPPKGDWLSVRRVDSVPARFGKVCASCGDKPVESHEYAAQYYGFRRKRYVTKTGEPLEYVAVQSWCKACRTSAKASDDSPRTYREREDRRGVVDAAALLDKVTARAESWPRARSPKARAALATRIANAID